MKKDLREERTKARKKLLIGIVISLIISAIAFFFWRDNFSSGLIASIISFSSALIFFFLFIYFRNNLTVSSRIRKIEEIFPDFLQLMSANLRAGMTIDRAMLLSSREEFAPLDKEILKTGRDITTGKNIESALDDMSKRIGSEKIKKTILLIISGIQAGGNLAILLEETSVNLRERGFVEKKAASSVLMYVIFIFLAVAIFAPALFSLSNVLVNVLTKLLGNVPVVEGSVAMPFTLSKINVSITFIKYFSILFIIVIDLLASLVLGLVGKGAEKEGLKYFIPILVLSLSTFFLAQIFLDNFLSGFF